MPDSLRVAVGPDQAVLFRPSARNPRYHVKAPQRLRLAGYALRIDRVQRIFDGALPPALAPLLESDVENRSEEHTSELQSLMRISYAVFCLKKKKKIEHK